MTGMGHREKGVTFTGWLIILTIMGFFIMLGLKIIPIYLENYTVKELVRGLEDEPAITRKTPAEVKQIIMHRININGIYDLPRDKVKVKKSSGITRVSIDYNVRKNVFANIDLIVSFSEKIELVSN